MGKNHENLTLSTSKKYYVTLFKMILVKIMFPKIDFFIDKLALKPLDYRCTITLAENSDINNHLVWHDKVYFFTVKSRGHTSYGLIDPFPRWNLHHEK